MSNFLNKMGTVVATMLKRYVYVLKYFSSDINNLNMPCHSFFVFNRGDTIKYLGHSYPHSIVKCFPTWTEMTQIKHFFWNGGKLEGHMCYHHALLSDILSTYVSKWNFRVLCLLYYVSRL